MHTNVEEQRAQFVRDFESGHWTMTELCERYDVSRPTGYKWLERGRETGAVWSDRSRAPHQCPHRTSADVEALIVAARHQYGWGAKKLGQVLRTRYPDRHLPVRSTINAVLNRYGLLRKRRRRPTWAHPGAPPLATHAANQVWMADFKGQFRTGDGEYCYPLTVTDHFSRQLLLCHGLRSVRARPTKAAFRTLFREVGLPEVIRTDNGTPFASIGLHGLSPLNVWWLQLGISHHRIRPASPQDNGTHERMHRELKRETTRPPATGLRAQQHRFDAFRHRYNDVRPHEGIGDQTPASLWTASPRPYPEQLRPPEYDAHLEVRRISSHGTFRLHNQQTFLTTVLAGQQIGLEEVADDVWNIVYYRTLLGRFDARTKQITGR